MDLQGKTAVVTGAGRGMGRAIALRLASSGAVVCVHYGSGREGAERTVADIVAAGGVAFALRADMAQLYELERLATDCAAEFAARTGVEGIDILVNNAGMSVQRLLETVDEETFDKIFSVNLKGPVFLTKYIVERMRDGGRVINVSSSTTGGAYPHAFVYTASKAALDNVTRSLAKHLGARGITVNAVAPGATATDMNAAALTGDRRKMVIDRTPLGRLGEPEDVADIVAFLAGPAGGWVTGQYIGADGGASL